MSEARSLCFAAQSWQKTAKFPKYFTFQSNQIFISCSQIENSGHSCFLVTEGYKVADQEDCGCEGPATVDELKQISGQTQWFSVAGMFDYRYHWKQ